MEIESAGNTPPRPWSLGEAAAAWAITRRVRVGAHAVRFREAGDGPVVVLVHGLGVSADYWVRNGPSIAARGFRVLAPDLPGFGRTDGPGRGLAVEDQAAAVGAWFDAMGLTSAVFLGHSLSCQTVIELAAARPEIVEGLILAAPTGAGRRPRRLARQLLGLALDIPRESFLFATLVAQAYLRAGPLRVLRTWLSGAGHDPLRATARVRSPGIVIVGDRDPIVDPGFARSLAESLQTGRVVPIPGAAHGVIFDETGRFDEVVVDFLNGRWRASDPG
jgi:2-hydroxy-6-oxonona-2,4-dienedioate hydrolase